MFFFEATDLHRVVFFQPFLYRESAIHYSNPP